MAEVSHIPPNQVVRPSRADARRNFDRLVAAADAVFSEQGVEAPLDEVGLLAVEQVAGPERPPRQRAKFRRRCSACPKASGRFSG